MTDELKTNMKSKRTIIQIFSLTLIAIVLTSILVGCGDKLPQKNTQDESAIQSSMQVPNTDVPSTEIPLPDEDSYKELFAIPVGSTEDYEKYIGVEYKVDMTDYEKYVCPENESEFVFLVNAANPLPSDYVPSDLVKCTYIRKGRSGSWAKINATANKALEAFLKEAAYYGFDDITVTNAYRPYSSQVSLFNKYFNRDIKQDFFCDSCVEYLDISEHPERIVNAERCRICKGEVTKQNGKNYCKSCDKAVSTSKIYCCSKCAAAVRRPTEAETEVQVSTYSSKPGTSEHQSGLCCDMHNLSSASSAFHNTPEANWLAANAHRFGFILRYPPNTQHITGIMHESWHFRYVGRTAATEMYEKSLTLEEYCAALADLK